MAFGIRPGLYRVAPGTPTDATDATVDVKSWFRPRGLLPHRTSTSTSRDGSVRAMGHNLKEGHTYHWTNGAVTKSPVLQDVPQGTYGVLAVHTHCDSATSFIHQCALGRVQVARPS